MSVVAGVDSSTQSCTVSLFDADSGKLLSQAQEPHARVAPPVSEQSPEQWWRAMTAALDRSLARAGMTAGVVDAVSIAGQCHALVPLDGARRVIRPAKLWNDTTSAPQATRLVDRLGAAQWSQRTGSVPSPAFTITKLAWLAEAEPAHFRALRHVLLPHDYLTFKLTDELATDASEASGTGYFDVSTRAWCTELLELVDPCRDWAVMLPQVHGPTDPAGRVSAEAQAETGLRVGIPVGPGAGDQHAAALALGLRDSDVLVSLGTSGVVLTRSDAPVADATGMVTGVCDASGRYLPLVCTLNGTQVTDAFASLLGVDVTGLSDLAVAEAADQPGRPVLAAFLGGERSPNLPGARGLLGGLSLDLTRGQVARAAFEGVLLGLVRGMEALKALGLDLSGRLMITGGGSRSPAYRQLLADLTQREVSVVDVPDATVRGAALQAAAVLSGRPIDEVAADWAPSVAGKVAPRPAAAEQIRDRYTELSSWPRHQRLWME